MAREPGDTGEDKAIMFIFGFLLAPLYAILFPFRCITDWHKEKNRPEIILGGDRELHKRYKQAIAGGTNISFSEFVTREAEFSMHKHEREKINHHSKRSKKTQP